MEPSKSPAPSSGKVGWGSFVLGAVIGFIAVLLWSRSQPHFLGAYEIRGENRSILVLSHAFLGALAGGFAVAAIDLLRRCITAGRSTGSFDGMSKRIAVLTTTFILGAVISGVVEAAVEVFVFGHFDRKFRDAPRVAFEVALYGAAAISVIGGVVVGIVTFLLRRRLTASDQLVGPLFLFGVAYPLMVMAIVQMAGRVGVVLGWTFMIAAPALFVYAAIVRKGSHAV